MPEQLPLFPLQLVLFPGERLKLHIFEERYKQLIGECLETGAEFGIPTYFDERVAEYGTTARVVECFRTYDSGEMDIATEGVRVFHLEEFERVAPGKLYPSGMATWVPNEPAPGSEYEVELTALYRRLHELLDTGREEPRASASADLSFRLGHESGLTLGQKVELLSIPEEARRQRYLLDHLRRAVHLLEGAAETRARVQGNGQFHRFPKLDL